jgi:hypothetical protein
VRNPGDLVIVSPDSGLIVSQDEFEKGTFTHNSVTFRFLTNYIETTELKRRHQLLRLQHSPIFADFDTAVRGFMKNPQAELEQFKTDLTDFFKRLSELFPAGEQSLKVAESVFLREAENFAKGETGEELYAVKGFEGNKQKFMASCYAKGGYSLAASGDVTGALQGLAYATIVDLDEAQHKAALGDYLENLKKLHFAKTTAKNMEEFYATHLSHTFDRDAAVQTYSSDLADHFVKAVALIKPPL